MTARYCLRPLPFGETGRQGLRGSALCLVGLGTALALGCTGSGDDPKLSKQAADEAIPNVPVPPESNPPIAAIADLAPVLERPAPGAKQVGYLHAGGRVARGLAPFGKEGCAGGWYPVRPAGFLCAGESATIDLRHPTLAAMAIQPMLEQALPYTYARARSETPLYERNPAENAGVREIGKLKKRAGMAVVGSWTASAPGGGPERLALLSNGKFVKAADLEAAEPSSFAGATLDKEVRLPLASTTTRGSS
jgi:hypothetical protein